MASCGSKAHLPARWADVISAKNLLHTRTARLFDLICLPTVAYIRRDSSGEMDRGPLLRRYHKTDLLVKPAPRLPERELARGPLPLQAVTRARRPDSRAFRFPTRTGNSVITGHVTLASGRDRPFYALRALHWDDTIVIHYGGRRYVCSVRSTASVRPDDSQTLRHEDRAWLTLLTREGYDPLSGEYPRRYLVKAVLVGVD